MGIKKMSNKLLATTTKTARKGLFAVGFLSTLHPDARNGIVWCRNLHIFY
jgi:hypothetical protein